MNLFLVLGLVTSGSKSCSYPDLHSITLEVHVVSEFLIFEYLDAGAGVIKFIDLFKAGLNVGRNILDFLTNWSHGS